MPETMDHERTANVSEEAASDNFPRKKVSSNNNLPNATAITTSVASSTCFEFSASSDPGKPVDLTNNSNSNKNGLILCNNNHKNGSSSNSVSPVSIVTGSSGCVVNNNNNNDEFPTTGVVQAQSNKMRSDSTSTSGTCAGIVRKLSFSVENILDPSKFTRKTTSVFPSAASSKSFFDTQFLISQHKTADINFSFKEIHGKQYTVSCYRDLHQKRNHNGRKLSLFFWDRRIRVHNSIWAEILCISSRFFQVNSKTSNWQFILKALVQKLHFFVLNYA